MPYDASSGDSAIAESDVKVGAAMDLAGKRVIIVGERDGVPGPAIEACVRTAGGDPVLVQTQCFV